MRDAAVLYIVCGEVSYPPIQCEPVEYQFCHTARKIRIIIDISAARRPRDNQHIAPADSEAAEDMKIVAGKAAKAAPELVAGYAQIAGAHAGTQMP